MARRSNDQSFDRLRGPRRAETLPVRFDESPVQIPEIGVHRRRGSREQHHTAAGIPCPRDTINFEDDDSYRYNDQPTTRVFHRRTSSSPPPPEIPQRHPSASVEGRTAQDFTYTSRRMERQPASYFTSVPPPVLMEEDSNDYYLDSPYYTRRTRSRGRWRSRSRSRPRSRHRYSRPRSSSHGRVPHLESYDVRYGDVRTRALGIDSELSSTESEAYSFSLSRHNKDFLPADNTQISRPEISERNPPTPSLQLHRSSTVQRPKVDRIIQSHYTGDGTIGGIHSVEFKVAPGQTPLAGRLPVPLFDWIRFEDSSMDLDNFQSGTLSLDGLHESERVGISRLLGRVQRIYDKTVQVSTRTKIKRMIPKLLQQPIRDETPSAASKPRKLIWLCLPYFCLQKYTSSNVQPASHPPRTLLQTRQSMTPKERDLKQAVCHLPGTPAGSCFHIGQAWFLILEDSFIISCAGVSTSQLNKDSISIVPYRNDKPGSSTHTLLVSNAGSCLWSIPLEECKTWIDFVKHFFQLWPLGFEFLYGGKVITPMEWPKISKEAERSKLCLEFKFSSKSKKSPTGILNAPRESIGAFDKGASQRPEEDDMSNQPDPDTKDTESASPHASKGTDPPVSDEFHMFDWMNMYIAQPKKHRNSNSKQTHEVLVKVNKVLLQDDLQEVEDYLLQKTSLHERSTYKSSPMRTRKQFYNLLFEAENKARGDDSLRSVYELQVELANAAETLFCFFLSPQNTGPTTQRYWGPLYNISLAILPYGLDESPENDDPNTVPPIYPGRTSNADMADVKQIAEWMDVIGRRTELFKELLSQVPAAERCKINVSDKFPRAWLHLLMALAFTKDMAPPFNLHMNLCLDLIVEGMRETIQALSKYKLSDYTVFGPFDIASLLTFQLSQDLTGLCPDICESYVDYMRSLEFDIDADPIKREHQGRITDLKQEVSVILETLETQKQVLSDAQNAQQRPSIQDDRANRAPAPRYEYKPSPFVEPRSRYYTSHEKADHLRDDYQFDLDLKAQSPLVNQSSTNNPRGIQGLLFRESLTLIEERIEVFRDINDRATYLETWNLRSIDTNKDRQETAVYAFTIVTIIFLPLSTVASILGMNTNDVRNMELTQWLFWVIALPLTIIIICLVLIWSDEWHNFWSGFGNLWGKKTKRSYVRLPDDYTGLEPRTGLAMMDTRATGVYPGGYYPPPPPPGLAPRLRTSHTIFGDEKYISKGPGYY